jgi:hypothetical protein
MERDQYNKESVLSLLETNPKAIKQANKYGETALYKAGKNGYTDIIKLITYYKKIHDLTPFDPIIDNDLQDSFEFESRNGETNIILTEKIFIRFLLKKIP